MYSRENMYPFLKVNTTNMLLNCRAKRMYENLNKHVILTTQYVGTIESSKTKNDVLN